MAGEIPAAGATPGVEFDGNVAVLRLGSGENRFNCDSIAAIHACLDEVERSPATALVTTAQGRIWSNGMDTTWVQASPDRAVEMFLDMERLLARMLCFPMRTVAALQGHTYAAGFLLALAHDERVMRADRGWMCLPEITFGAVFTRGMIDLVHTRLTPQLTHRAVIEAERFDAAQALANGLVDATAPADDLRRTAVTRAGRAPNVDRRVMAATKTNLHAHALGTLGSAPASELLVAAVLAR
jgi:enoyl-CoA hydratase/carnithine racemase